MNDRGLTSGITPNRLLELLAVIFNLLFTVLYLNGTAWCYLFGILGPLFLLVLCLRSKLYAEPVLQLFYIGFAVYGFLHQEAGVWSVIHHDFKFHLPYILGSLILSLIGGYFLTKYTEAKLPYLDSVVTVYAMTGTWFLVNNIHESWLYFIGVNAVSVVIYLRRSLFIGAAMFALYLLMSLDGFFELKIFYS